MNIKKLDTQLRMPTVVVLACALLLALPGLASAQTITDASSATGPNQPVLDPPPEPARLPQFGIGVRVGFLFNAERARDPLFEADSSGQIGLAIDVRPISIIPGDQLRFGLEWVNGVSQATTFQVFTAEYTDHHVMAFADYGYRVLDWLVPYVRAGVGVAFYDVELTGVSTLAGHDHWLFTGYASGGLEFVADFSWIDFGARLEGGYAFRQNPEFTISGSHSAPEDETDIPMTGTNIGELPVSGALFTIEVFARF